MKCIWNTGYKTVISKDVADEIEKTYGWKHTTTIILLARLRFFNIIENWEACTLYSINKRERISQNRGKKSF
ncbi:hypothetical protein I4O97_010375 [Clostridioides difficile]